MHIEVELGPIDLEEILQIARREDLDEAGDLTTQLLPESISLGKSKWALVARQPGRFCSKELLARMLPILAPELRIDWTFDTPSTADIAAGRTLARVSGVVAQMLAAERTILNFLQHLSGVATLTSRFVNAVDGMHTKIYDTRKTTPGLRALEKYAVRCGGGHNHRIGLYDAVLIKDNHLAGIPVSRLAHCTFDMLNRLAALPAKPAFVEVECDSIEQAVELFKVTGIDVILLDNFQIERLRETVRLRDKLGLRTRVQLEASGGITLDNVREVAETGVERIAIGAITHSAPILDLGFDAL